MFQMIVTSMVAGRGCQAGDVTPRQRQRRSGLAASYLGQ
jgi:hypothetical protein